MTESHISEKIEMITLHQVLFILFSFMLVYNYYSSTTAIEVHISDPKFTLLGPYNTSDVKLEDKYHQLIDIKHFSFLVNPQPCREYKKGLLLMIIVSSNPSNYENRMLIRNTWGQKVDSTKLVFMFGESENFNISRQIQKESETYGDVVQGNFIDAYRNMTYKHIMGLKWVSHHCPMAKYVLKTDDDVVINSHALRRFLARELSPWGAKNLITCHVLEHAEVQRSDKSKWRVTVAEFEPYYYPTYCGGWAILYSQDVVAKLLKAAQTTPYFWIDDVHVTGVLAQKINVTRTPLSSLVLSQSREILLKRMGPKYAGPFIIGPPDLSATRMKQIWKAIPE